MIPRPVSRRVDVFFGVMYGAGLEDVEDRTSSR
jgi:hypothetical protein